MAKAKKKPGVKKGTPRKLSMALPVGTREALFIRAYTGGIKDVEPANGKQAAIYAGLGSTPNAAAVRAHMLLKRPDIRERVRRAMEAADVTADRVRRELAMIAFHRVEDILDVHRAVMSGDVSGLDDIAQAAIQSVKVTQRHEGRGDDKQLVEDVEVRAYDKNAALRSLGQILRMIGPAPDPGGEGGGTRTEVHIYLPQVADAPQVIEGEVVAPALPPPSAVIELPESLPVDPDTSVVGVTTS